MNLWNLFILHRVKPLWLSKLIANIFGFIMIYPIVLHNKETALLLSLFLAAYIYKNIQNLDSKNLDSNTTESNNTDSIDKTSNPTIKHADLAKSFIIYDFAIMQLMISCFCACIFVFTTWQIYVLEAIFGCIFIRIYGYYKPSLIGRFYNLETNKILGNILGAILHGVLSGASVMMLYFLSVKLS